MNNSKATTSNQGVMISGGTVQVRDMAVGDGAAIHSHTESSQGSQELIAALNELVSRMEQEGVDQDKIAAAKLAQSELQKEKPNGTVVKALVSGVVDSVKSISAIATSVASVAALIAGT